MEAEFSKKAADCTTAGLVSATERREPRLLHSQAPHARCCGRRALVAGFVIAFTGNMLLTILAIGFALLRVHAAIDAGAEIGELRDKLQSQKELLATILNAVTGTEVTPEETEATESARAALGLRSEKDSAPGGQLPLAASLLADTEEANMHGGGVNGPAGSGVETGGVGTNDGDGDSRLPNAIPKAGRRRTKRAAPIQHCDCTNPDSRNLNWCCCNRRANNSHFYNRTTIEKYRQLLKKKAAGHFVACIPSKTDLDENRPAGEMIAYSLFRSRTRDIFIGDEEPWSTFSSSRDAFVFEPLRATLTIKQEGLYLVYAQVAHVMFTVSSMTVNDIEWLRCQHRPTTPEYTRSPMPSGRESCSMYGVRPLLAGDKLVIQNGLAEVVAEVTQPHCTNFGIVKL